MQKTTDIKLKLVNLTNEERKLFIFDEIKRNNITYDEFLILLKYVH